MSIILEFPTPPQTLTERIIKTSLIATEIADRLCQIGSGKRLYEVSVTDRSFYHTVAEAAVEAVLGTKDPA